MNAKLYCVMAALTCHVSDSGVQRGASISPARLHEIRPRCRAMVALSDKIGNKYDNYLIPNRSITKIALFVIYRLSIR